MMGRVLAPPSISVKVNEERARGGSVSTKVVSPSTRNNGNDLEVTYLLEACKTRTKLERTPDLKSTQAFLPPRYQPALHNTIGRCRIY